MKKYVGIWLDRRKAFLVYLTENPVLFDGRREMLEQIESGIERRVRLSGGSRTGKTPYGPQEIAVDGKQDERIRRRLGEYYNKILNRISDADRVLIFGPGEAKKELQKEIERSKILPLRKLTSQAADKMTANQIVARAKDFFEL